MCPSGYEVITGMYECEAAASNLGLVDTVVSQGSSSTSPYGCYYRASSSSGSRLWLNSAGAYYNYDTGRTALCRQTVGYYNTEEASADDASPERQTTAITVVVAIGGVTAFVAAVALVVAMKIRKQREYEGLELATALEDDGGDARL